MEEIFIQLAIILFIALIFSYIARAFNQPIIIGYILAGVIISPFILKFGASDQIINSFSKFGVAFLLFIVGLHMNPKVIRNIGSPSLLIGSAQIILTFGIGFLASLYILKYDFITSAYVGIAISFSSTIIIMKFLSDKRQLDSLYGKISIGILIIQDLVAIASLMFISSLSNGADFSSFAIRGVLIGGGLIFLLFLAGVFIIPRITKELAKSQELLFLFSISWCFILAAVFSYLGFSVEIGALVAGVVLSISPYSIEISSKIRPLRDFFLIIFFIILGLNIHISNFNSIVANALILSIIALIFKPVILMGFMAIFGYTKRSNFLVGATLAQISEFSVIIAALGLAIGHINEEILSTLTLTLVITITISSYAIINPDKLYNKLSKYLFIFERKSIREERKINKEYDAILFGYNRIGFTVLRSLKNIKKKYLVVDFNPDTISILSKFKIPCLYGDAGDSELLDELPLNKTQLVVSTVPDIGVNLLVIDSIKKVNKDAIIIVRASQIKDALELYKKGASYVLTPHFLGGEYVAKMINDLKLSGEKYKDEKEKHIKMLAERIEKEAESPGHHPEERVNNE